MDQKKPAKRARSLTPTKGGQSGESTPKKRKTSKKKDKKNKSFSNGGPTSETPDREPTNASQAPEEIMMAQMLLTFSNVEQARFAAYTRSKLPTRAVEDWITAVLRDRLKQPHASLADMVSTDQANEICWTISMAAKIFAQRLVSDSLKNYPEDSPGPSPRAVWKAMQDHQDDLGLFLQPHTAIRLNWSGTEVAAHQQARLAAEQAQEEYDTDHPTPEGADPAVPQARET